MAFWRESPEGPFFAPVTQFFGACYSICYAAEGQLGENMACYGAFFYESPALLCYAALTSGPRLWYCFGVCYTVP